MTAISIRPYRIEDAADLYQAAVESTAEVFPWLPWCRPGYEMADATGWVPGQVERWSTGEEHQFVIQSADGRFLGGCGLNGINRDDGHANLGYWVRTSAMGQGVAPQAVRQLRDWAFGHTSLVRLEIVVAVGIPVAPGWRRRREPSSRACCAAGYGFTVSSTTPGCTH